MLNEQSSRGLDDLASRLAGRELTAGRIVRALDRPLDGPVQAELTPNIDLVIILVNMAPAWAPHPGDEFDECESAAWTRRRGGEKPEAICRVLSRSPWHGGDHGRLIERIG